MLKYIIQRLVVMLPTLFLIILLNFCIIQLAPGGVVEQAIIQIQQKNIIDGVYHTSLAYQGSQGLSPEMLAKIKQQYGFDQPLFQRFFHMLNQYVHFDFGQSFFKGKSVIELIKDKLPVSISLGFWSFLFIYAIAIPLGIKKAEKNGLFFDKITSILLIISYAIPTFVIAMILIVLFAGGSFWQIFPLQGLVSEHFATLSWLEKIKDYFWHICLPILAMVLSGFASLTYLTKYSFLEEMNKHYVLVARAKGLSEQRILYHHILKNALIVVIAGLPEALMGILFVGNLFIEIIFNLDGLGLLAYESILQRDYPVIFGLLFIFTSLSLIFRLIGDILYQMIDPRIDFQKRQY